MINNIYLIKEAKAWIKRSNGIGEIIQIVADLENSKNVIAYFLYSSFDENPDYLGQILFDMQGYWIYDGNTLAIIEQEQIAKFIINYTMALADE